jgi:uncharacterized membrane protein YdfJ with MMPL/SSD domain
VFAFVLGLAFLLLMVTFRSVALPALSICLNLLSVGAAYGLMTLIFQDGHLQACSASPRTAGSRRGCRYSCSSCCSG